MREFQQLQAIFLVSDNKSPDRIRHELRALFDAGLSWAEARPMVVPVFDNMRAAYRAEWMDWERNKTIDEVCAIVSKHMGAAP